MKHARTLNSEEILKLIFIYLTEVSSSRDYDDVIRILADMGRALTNADRCTVWLVDEENKKLWTKIAHGMNRIEIPIDSGIVGHAIKTQKKIIINDVYKDEKFNKEIDIRTGYTTKSMMIIPMFANDYDIIGAFQVINSKSENGVFSQDDMQKLMLASTYAAESITSTILTKEIDDTQREVVFTMGAIAESRSKETGNHVKRVAQYSKILAIAYGMDKEEAEMLKQASPMHDIGKVAIADLILNKPGRFTISEFEIMKRHAELGYAMIKNSHRPLLQTAAIVAYEHHEKYNGKGYPRGLKGEDIHIYGRITAIADVFDALGSDRVYKKAWKDEKIFKLFKEERGEHFDPKIVDLFFENLDEILKIREKFKDFYQDEIDNKQSIQESIKILGAYGTKAKGYGTSAFLLNNKNVIDAGNLLNPLEEQSAQIENIWLTHSHLDHISDIAYILDNYLSQRDKELNVIGLPQTIDTLKKHFFNGLIWPDFTRILIPASDKFALKYTEIELEKEYTLADDETIEAFETDHTVDSCGYIYKKNNKGIIITADTYSLDSLITRVNSDKEIKAMVIECSFPVSLEELAKKSKHLTPKLLFESLKKLKRDDVKLYINHIKPMYIEIVTKEIEQYKGEIGVIILKDLDIIEF